jgi:hypothetical protein
MLSALAISRIDFEIGQFSECLEIEVRRQGVPCGTSLQDITLKPDFVDCSVDCSLPVCSLHANTHELGLMLQSPAKTVV